MRWQHEPGEEPTLDPTALTVAQRYGDACVVCHKRWPRPRTRVGRLPDGSEVRACEDCAPRRDSRTPHPDVPPVLRIHG